MKDFFFNPIYRLYFKAELFGFVCLFPCLFKVLISKYPSVINFYTTIHENIVLLSSLQLYNIHIQIKTTGCVESYYYNIHPCRFHLSFPAANHLEKMKPKNQIGIFRLPAIIPLIIYSPWIIFCRSEMLMLHLPLLSMVWEQKNVPISLSTVI